jgi:anti-anti-sigma factor
MDTKHIRTRQIGDVLLVHFNETRMLNEELINTIVEELLELIAQGGKMVISFLAVEYISGALCSKILKVKRKIAKSNGQLRLCDVRNPFEITHLDANFNIYETEEVAVQGF